MVKLTGLEFVEILLHQAPKYWVLGNIGLSHNAHEVLKFSLRQIYKDRKLTKINSNKSLKKTITDMKRHSLANSWMSVSVFTAPEAE